MDTGPARRPSTRRRERVHYWPGLRHCTYAVSCCAARAVALAVCCLGCSVAQSAFLGECKLLQFLDCVSMEPYGEW
eukprot:scaffold138320_cov22-Tisochrysis_lutea.AAC.1